MPPDDAPAVGRRPSSDDEPPSLRQQRSPRLSSLWSSGSNLTDRIGAARHAPHSGWADAPRTFSNILVVGAVCLALANEISNDPAVLGASNGRMISFLKSVHSTNYYWCGTLAYISHI